MPRKHRAPAVRDQDRSSPAVREPHILQDRMQPAHAMLQARDQFRCLPCRDVQFRKFAPIIQVHQPAAEHNATRAQ